MMVRGRAELGLVERTEVSSTQSEDTEEAKVISTE